MQPIKVYFTGCLWRTFYLLITASAIFLAYWRVKQKAELLLKKKPFKPQARQDGHLVHQILITSLCSQIVGYCNANKALAGMSVFFFSQSSFVAAVPGWMWDRSVHVNITYKADYLWLESHLVLSQQALQQPYCPLWHCLTRRNRPEVFFAGFCAIMKLKSLQQMPLIMILFLAVW